MLAPQRDDPPVATKTLPVSTRPTNLPPGIDARKIVSVSEYSDKSYPFTTRVFRYVYQADYRATVDQFKKLLLKKDGWKNAPSSSVETDFWKYNPTGSLAKQGIIVQATRLIQDKNAPTGWTALPPDKAKGWVWISYSEEVRAKKK